MARLAQDSVDLNAAYGDNRISEDAASVVQGDTFPDPPSSHENLSVFYDPLAL